LEWKNWTVKQKPVTSGYATWFMAGGAIRIAHYDVIDDVIIWVQDGNCKNDSREF